MHAMGKKGDNRGNGTKVKDEMLSLLLFMVFLLGNICL